MRLKIAVIGAGISGLGAALALSARHDVTVLERDSRPGGHANTLTVTGPAGPVAVDTGFIVYNTRNYPNLTALFTHLDVPTQWSDMSFGFSRQGGALEFACDSLDKIFAQRRNLLSPRFLRGVRDIRRFHAIAPVQMDAGHLDGVSLGDWIAREGFSDWFRDCFLLPMGGAIWSTPTGEMQAFPARSLVAFFRNHDLLTGLAPAQRWRTVTGGSRAYLARLLAALPRPVVTGATLRGVARTAAGPVVIHGDGREERFDHVLIATHAPEAVALLGSGLDTRERAILGAFRTARNRAVLHSDPALMPKRRKVWSSWNFLSGGAEADSRAPAPVSYWMNRLQGLPETLPLFVSLNPGCAPDPALTHAEIDYAHPLFDAASFAAQAALDGVQGTGGVWFAGAWTGYGFHEDGLRAGLRVAEALGCRPEWAIDTGLPLAPSLARAAE